MEYLVANAVIALLVLMVLMAFFFRKPKHMKTLRSKHVLITGGSSGIGFALAKVCLSEGAFVTLMARTHTKLLNAHETLIKTMGYPSDHILLKAVDVSDAAAVSLAITDSFNWRPIDMLICNAGRVLAGQLDKVNVEDLESLTRTNILGCVFPLHAALPLMKLRSFENPSSIVIMGSMSSMAFTNDVNMYTPTKFALKGLAEYLRIELMPYNIPVSLACPGFTDTPMLDEADRACHTSNLLYKLCLYNRARAESPDDVATKTIEGAKRGDLLITTSFTGFFIGVLARGWIPADSLARALVEVISVIPVRIISLVWFLYMKRVMQKHLEENLEKRKHEKEIPYVHNIDDSAADDDSNLHLWSH